MHDVYNAEARYRRALASLDTDSRDSRGRRSKITCEGVLCEANKAHLRQFLKTLELNGLSAVRRTKYLYELRKFGIVLGKNFKECDRDDVARLLDALANEGYAPWTLIDARVLLKKFYCWLHDAPANNPPSCVAWVKVRKHSEPKYNDADMLEVEEYERILAAAPNTRDKFLIALLWGTGLRIGEALRLRVGDVRTEETTGEWGVNVLTGKNKFAARGVPFVFDSERVAQYYEAHVATLADKTGLLFLNERNKPLGHGGVSRLLRHAFETAEIKKPDAAHALRHSFATRAADLVREGKLDYLLYCAILGWAPNSPMVEVYVHRKKTAAFAVVAQIHAQEDGAQSKFMASAEAVVDWLFAQPKLKAVAQKLITENRESVPELQQFDRLTCGSLTFTKNPVGGKSRLSLKSHKTVAPERKAKNTRSK